MRERIAVAAVLAVLAVLCVLAGFGVSAIAQAPAGAYAAVDFRTLEGVLLGRVGQLDASVADLADAVRAWPAPGHWSPEEPTSVRLLARPAGGRTGYERYSLRVEVRPAAAAAWVQCAWEHDGGTTLWHGTLSATVQMTPSGGDSVTVYCYSHRGEELVDIWRVR